MYFNSSSRFSNYTTIVKMKIRICIFALVVFSTVLVNLSVLAKTKTILVIGDSISSAYGMDHESGWVNLLQTRLHDHGKDYEVINASITGDVSASGRQRITKLLKRHEPELVIIELGGNDGLRGLSLSELKSNLQSMISDSINQGAKVVLAGMKILPNYGPGYTAAFEQVYHDLASENTITLIPFILEGIGGVADKMQADGIHPNEQAQHIIVDNVWVELTTLL